MIETHVVNATLLPQFKSESLFFVITFINGLVAPSFLFCAGFAFAITIERKWNEYTGLHKSFWRYLVRIGFILVIGYCLHIPSFSLKGIMELNDPARWQSFYQADILHVISLTLFFSAILVVVVRKRLTFDYAIGIIAAAFIFLAPPVRALDYSDMAVWLRPYLTVKYKSQFPLFPWSAFLLCGILIGTWMVRHNNSSNMSKAMNRLALASLAMIVISLGIEALPLTVYPGLKFWNASPEFFFVRLGIICFILVGCWATEYRPAGWVRNVVTVFGVESLLIYVVHLLIVYGYTFEWSFIRLFGKKLTYPESSILVIGLIAGMYLLALGWHSLKKWNKTVANVVQFAVLAVIVIRFIVE